MSSFDARIEVPCRSEIGLIRRIEAEKWQQIANAERYQHNRNVHAADGLASLRKTARDRQNVFASLMEAVKTHSLGQISHALYYVGGGIGEICRHDVELYCLWRLHFRVF